MINLPNLIDDAKCFQTVRDRHWPYGVTCPHCSSTKIVKDGKEDTQPQRQRDDCRACGRCFDDLTGTVFAGHHQPLKIWILSKLVAIPPLRPRARLLPMPEGGGSRCDEFGGGSGRGRDLAHISIIVLIDIA